MSHRRSTFRGPKPARWFFVRYAAPDWHLRLRLHFTPTSSSWLNLVERWFREITDKRIRRGAFRTVKELVAAIEDDVAQHNENPQSFTWTAKAEAFLEKIRRARAVLDKVQTA